MGRGSRNRQQRRERRFALEDQHVLVMIPELYEELPHELRTVLGLTHPEHLEAAEAAVTGARRERRRRAFSLIRPENVIARIQEGASPQEAVQAEVNSTVLGVWEGSAAELLEIEIARELREHTKDALAGALHLIAQEQGEEAVEELTTRGFSALLGIVGSLAEGRSGLFEVSAQTGVDEHTHTARMGFLSGPDGAQMDDPYPCALTLALALARGGGAVLLTWEGAEHPVLGRIKQETRTWRVHEGALAEIAPAAGAL